MSSSPDFEGWIIIVIAAIVGLASAWWADSHRVTDNIARSAGYTIILFACLVMALRPAWRHPRLWLNLLMLLALHVALILPLVAFLDARSIRLNWALALPFTGVELVVFLGFLWRRNVNDASR